MRAKRPARTVGLALALAACARSSGPLMASGAWARPTPPGATDGVVYLEVRTDRADAITGATVDAAVARSASLHESSGGSGGSSHHGTSDIGVVTMRAVTSFPLEPGRSLSLKPGGRHLMLEQLAAPLVEDRRFTVTLTLASGRTLEVHVVVATNAPR